MAAVLLMLDGAGYQGRLRPVEAGENAAGHSDEEHRDEGDALEVAPQSRRSNQ